MFFRKLSKCPEHTILGASNIDQERHSIFKLHYYILHLMGKKNKRKEGLNKDLNILFMN